MVEDGVRERWGLAIQGLVGPGKDFGYFSGKPVEAFELRDDDLIYVLEDCSGCWWRKDH